jgi:hypothetical protein
MSVQKVRPLNHPRDEVVKEKKKKRWGGQEMTSHHSITKESPRRPVRGSGLFLLCFQTPSRRLGREEQK